jgi:hypothetical protein
MTRAILSHFIDLVGITDASIMLHRYPHTLERWRDGQDDIPRHVADWLADWDAGWRTGYSPAEQARIEAMANSKGSELDEQTAAELWEFLGRFDPIT